MAVKWFTTILSLYLLGLSIWPCADEVQPIPRQGHATVLAKADRSYPGSSHEHHDQCTPFCSCSCCAAIVTLLPQFSYKLTASVAIKPVVATSFRYTSPHWADTLSAIWQPPKITV